MYFSRVTPESRKQWVNAKGKKDFQPRILYPLKLSIKCESRIKTFLTCKLLHLSSLYFFSEDTRGQFTPKKKKRERENKLGGQYGMQKTFGDREMKEIPYDEEIL